MLPELYDEETPVELDRAIDGELEARRTMIRLAQLNRDREKLDHRRRAVDDTYRHELGKVDATISELRRQLAAYLEQGGDAKFPDVGTAYLATGKPKVKIVDRDAARERYGSVFVVEHFDEAAFKAWALEQATSTGELAAGVELEPGGPELRIRGAS